MAKIITIPSSIEEINLSKNLIDGYIIGIKDMCVNTNFCISDLNILNDINDKEIFISINKNMHNNDLKYLKELLIDLNNYNIKGVLYYDVSVLNIYNGLNLNYELVWASEHLTTNYNTINYWNEIGAKYAYISSDITLTEIKEIIKNSKSKLMVNMFGYLPMFVSKRHIVKNYLEHFNLNDKSNINYMEKEGNVYPIIDNNVGTFCYSCNILNGIKAYTDINIDYIVLNSFDIDVNKFIEVIKYFKSVNKENVLEYEEKINSMFKNVDTGFLSMKTVYRVKKNEK